MSKWTISAIVLLITLTGRGQVEGEIRGIVTDTSSVGQANVRIDILNHSGAKSSWNSHSDTDGRYALTNLRPGFYNIQFSSHCYGTIVVNSVPVGRDATTLIDVILRSSAHKEIEVVPYLRPLLDFQRVIIE